MVNEYRKAKRNYFELKLDKNKKDQDKNKNSKRMWQLLKELLKGNSFNDNIYTEIQYGELKINNIFEMAKTFNRNFIDSLSTTIENDCMIELSASKFIQSELKVFSTTDINKLNRIINKLEN